MPYREILSPRFLRIDLASSVHTSKTSGLVFHSTALASGKETGKLNQFYNFQVTENGIFSVLNPVLTKHKNGILCMILAQNNKRQSKDFEKWLLN